MFKNTKVRQQLNLIVLIVTSLVILLSGIYIGLLVQIQARTITSNTLNSGAIAASEASGWVQFTAHDTNAYALGHTSHLEEFAEHVEGLNATLLELEAVESSMSDEELQLFETTQSTLDEYILAAEGLFAATNVLFAATADAEQEAALAQQDSAWEVQDVLGDELATVFGILADNFQAEATDASAQLEQTISAANTLGIILPIIIVLLVAFIVVSIRNAITRPLDILTQTTQSLSAGDYNIQANVESTNEFGSLAQSFNKMAETIQQRENRLNQLNQTLENRVEELRLARDEAVTAQRIAKENSRLKSEFLSTMSHELRTPLNAIEGFTSIMLGGMGIDLSPRAEDMVTRISSNSNRLLYLINDFLDLSRIEAGRLEIVNEEIVLSELVNKWRDQVGVLAESKGVDFVVTIDPDLPATVLADEDSLSKVAINLLGNAFKFTHEGQVSLDLKRSANTWLLAVTDTGIGIPAHAREYIFDEFRQVDGSSKRLYGGTGLGLSLVQKLSRSMGGNVMVQSDVGQGSTFTVTLPLEIAI